MLVPWDPLGRGLFLYFCIGDARRRKYTVLEAIIGINDGNWRRGD
jgi:hypothetical protein